MHSGMHSGMHAYVVECHRIRVVIILQAYGHYADTISYNPSQSQSSHRLFLNSFV